MTDPIDPPASADTITVRFPRGLMQRLQREADAAGRSAAEICDVALETWRDRAVYGYHVEYAHAVRELQALELATEALVDANLTLAATITRLETGGLTVLIQLATLARQELTATQAPTPSQQGGGQ